MVKTLQKKFIITAMVAISLLIVALVGGINIFNFISYSDETSRLLTMVSGEGENPGENFDKNWNKGDKGGFFGRPMGKDDAMAARYFTVLFSSEKNIIHTNVSNISSVSEDEANKMAADILNYTSFTGDYGNFKYKIKDAPKNGKLVTVLDCGRQISNFFTVLFISVIAAIICWGIMLLIVVLLSKKAIRPIAKNIEKQKQFVTNAGHEIKTPLAIILANTDALELHNGETKWSKNIRTQTKRLGGLMQNLLTLSRMDESTEVPVCEFDLSETFESTVSAFIEPAALKGVMTETDITKDIKFTGNKENIIQLITVLMDNAVKYTEEGGKITAELIRRDKNIVMRVKNTFPKIENPEKLFDRFYRADDARTQKNGGYGIGLSVAQAIVQIHKGTITAQSIDNELSIIVRL